MHTLNSAVLHDRKEDGEELGELLITTFVRKSFYLEKKKKIEIRPKTVEF